MLCPNIKRYYIHLYVSLYLTNKALLCRNVSFQSFKNFIRWQVHLRKIEQIKSFLQPLNKKTFVSPSLWLYRIM